MNYHYTSSAGAIRQKGKITNYVVSALAILATLVSVSGAAFAAGPTVSDQANPNACFGQARASYAKGGPNGALSPENNGSYISERKGDNPAINAEYIATVCNGSTDQE